MFDLLLKNGYVVDPVNGIKGLRDILINKGVICKIEPNISKSRVIDEINLDKKTVIPGIIDSHVHLTGNLDAGFKMLAKAGVTTAIDFSGPVEDVIRGMKEKGSGINIGVLQALVPKENLSGDSCGKNEIKDVIDKIMRKGALGIKILGGHYPFSPDTTGDIIDYTNKIRAYVAFHAGTTQTNRSFSAFKQAVDIAKDKRLHIAHVNSYCRGRCKSYIQEMSEAILLLDENENIVSDSYLSSFNGTSGKCIDGIPLSNVTKTELKHAGYNLTKEGLKNAIQEKHALVCMNDASENRLKGGMKAVSYFEENKTDVMISFRVNPSVNAVAFAMHKKRNGEFSVDTIATDGGGIPRNSIVKLGIPLTKHNDFSIQDFVIKTSVTPAKLFGLNKKGNLKEGMDADITVIDMLNNKPVITIANGKVVMIGGFVIGGGGTLISTDRAKLKTGDILKITANIAEGILYK